MYSLTFIVNESTSLEILTSSGILLLYDRPGDDAKHLPAA